MPSSLFVETGLLLGLQLAEYTRLTGQTQESACLCLTNALIVCVTTSCFVTWILGIKLRSSSLYGKYSAHRDIPPTHTHTPCMRVCMCVCPAQHLSSGTSSTCITNTGKVSLCRPPFLMGWMDSGPVSFSQDIISFSCNQ